MDPLTALIIAMWIAGRLTKNVSQDLAWKARGEDPPSFRREMARWEAKQARSANRSSDGPARRFWANAWADAVASADERRARVTEKAKERRRQKWTDADREAAEAEARDINDRVPAPTPEVQTWPCGGGCGRTLTHDDVAGYALSGDPLCRDCRTTPKDPPTPDEDWMRDPFPRPTSTMHDEVIWNCEGCGRQMRNAGQGGYVRGTRRCRDCQSDPAPLPVVQCADCGDDVRHRDATSVRVLGALLNVCPQCRVRRERKAQEFPEPPECPPTAYDDDLLVDYDPSKPGPDPVAEPPVRPVTDINEWRAKGSTPPITKEDIVSGETTNLSVALTWTQEMATQAGAAAASTETSIATMQNAGVSGPVLAKLAHAQDLASQLMAAYNDAHSELEADLVVKDAYQARSGAGDKEFVTQD